MFNTREIVTKLATMDPYIRYQTPFFGKTFKAIDQFADAQKMYADYTRNTGRKIKYPSFRDPRVTTTNIADSMVSGINGAGRTTRWLI